MLKVTTNNKVIVKFSDVWINLNRWILLGRIVFEETHFDTLKKASIHIINIFIQENKVIDDAHDFYTPR